MLIAPVGDERQPVNTIVYDDAVLVTLDCCRPDQGAKTAPVDFCRFTAEALARRQSGHVNKLCAVRFRSRPAALRHIADAHRLNRGDRGRRRRQPGAFQTIYLV
jgi:hypothetical protein